MVEAKLELRWSPQQISGWLVGAFPDQPEIWVSHETIYVSLFVQARGALRKELTRYLRRGAGRLAVGQNVCCCAGVAAENSTAASPRSTVNREGGP